MDDLINRQAAIDAIEELKKIHFDRRVVLGKAQDCINSIPSAHSPVDEWCVDCSEYDTERECCPRFNRVIRTAVTERNHGSWIDLHLQGDSRFMCSVCKWKEHVPTCMGKPTVWEYCPSCGARMDGDA